MHDDKTEAVWEMKEWSYNHFRHGPSSCQDYGILTREPSGGRDQYFALLEFIREAVQKKNVHGLQGTPGMAAQ